MLPPYTEPLIERARRGDGPSFLACATYRYHGHHVGDVDRGYYRSRDEEERWTAARDPIALLQTRLGDDARGRELAERIETEVDDAVAYALAAPFPDPREVDEDVYA